MRGPFPEMRVIFAEEFRRQVLNPGFIFVTAVILVPTVVIAVMIVAGVQGSRWWIPSRCYSGGAWTTRLASL